MTGTARWPQWLPRLARARAATAPVGLRAGVHASPLTPALVAWRVLAAALILGVAVQGARFVYAIATPVAPVGAWQPRLAPVMARDARLALYARVDPFNRQTTTASSDVNAVTSLPLTLFGTREDGVTGGGSAIIAGEDGIQRSIAVGEDILSGVRLAGVAFDHVVIDRAGARELLYLDQDGGADGGATGTAAAASAPAPGAAAGVTRGPPVSPSQSPSSSPSQSPPPSSPPASAAPAQTDI